MANISEKVFWVLAGNLNSGLKYLITTVLEVSIRSNTFNNMNTILETKIWAEETYRNTLEYTSSSFED